MRLLVKHGYHCDVANNGAEALERFHAKRYGLLLMDCQMPVMDGFQATASIRNFENGSHHTPIIAVTAHSMLGYREKCLAAGMDDYISKPIDEKSLVATIERWLLSPEPQDPTPAHPYPLPLTP
jgi:CheY-like chemotaxis protein